jgi:hypothetical protein
LLGVERGERRLVLHAENARPHAANVTRAFCGDDVLRIAPHPPYSPDFAPSGFSLFSCLEISKSASEDKNSGLQMNFSRESEEIVDEISVDTLEAVFRKWINRSDRCIHALQQMESTWNEVNNGPLSYS